MPKHIPINAAGFKGINSDLAPWDLPKEFINNGSNFRVGDGRIDSAGSSESLFVPAANYNGGHILPVNTPTAEYWITCGRSAVKVYDGLVETDISSVAGYASVSNELLWTSCLLGKIPIINNPQHVPEYWNPQTPATAMQPLMFDATNDFVTQGISFNVIRSFKNYLFAINLVESTVSYPNAYRWSHPADINGLPPSWDETDVAYIAGREQVGGETGVLIDGYALRNAFCLYAESGIYILDESQDEFVFRQRRLSETFGLLAKNCIAEIKGTHFFLTDGDILMNDGNRVDSVIYNTLRRRLQANASADYKSRSYVVKASDRKEIWFCVAEAGAQFPNIAYVYNWKEGSWSLHDIPYTEDGLGAVTSAIAHAAYGLQPTPELSYADMATRGETYANTVLTYATAAGTSSAAVIGVDNVNTELVDLDPVSPAPGRPDTDFLVERTDLPFDGQQSVSTITRVYPFMDSPDPVQIQVGSQQFAGGPVEWESPVTFDPSSERKVDFRSTGMLHAWRVKSIGEGVVSMSGMNIEYEPDGFR
jgi:hypothetical protein